MLVAIQCSRATEIPGSKTWPSMPEKIAPLLKRNGNAPNWF